MLIPELLAPAGSPEALDAAIAEGADAVYLGLKNFNARMRSANFAYSQFEAALKALHRLNKKIYVTVNTVFEDREADRMYQLLKYLAALGPDGILVQDFGIITMVRENFPSLKLHASTQMNIASARGVNLLSRYGFSRAVLARELSAGEIREIRRNTNMELEVFVHGALCISISGLCLFSSFLGGKSANRGMCAQACRRFYTPEGALNGAYYFSPNDLELIEKIPFLAEAGINSLKIEGRMKSAEYVGTVVSAYRLVLDNLESGPERLEDAVSRAKEILRNDFARAKTSYLFESGIPDKNGIPGDTVFDWLNPFQNGGTGIPLGKILKVRGKEIRMGLIDGGPVMPVIGDTIRLHSSDDSGRESHKVISAENESGSGRRWVSVPDNFKIGDAVYLIQTRAMTKRYPAIIKKTMESAGRSPGRDRAPPPKAALKFQAGKGRQGTLDLNEGIYVQVSLAEDLYALQSVRPEKVILLLNHSLLPRLINRKQPLPFTADNIIVGLDPFFPQDQEDELANDISCLIQEGYRYFMLNNPGQFSFFRNVNENLVLIAGPWLYVYNNWSLSFINSLGAGFFVSPPENNRQNLERTLSRGAPAIRRRAFITVFSRPSLFRIRSNLGSLYDFSKFNGSKNEEFRLACTPNSAGTRNPCNSLVYPEVSFYIADKIPFLKEAGFRRFILDLSWGPVKKTEYKELMKAVSEAAPPAGISRFNWKDGFFRNPADT